MHRIIDSDITATFSPSTKTNGARLYTTETTIKKLQLTHEDTIVKNSNIPTDYCLKRVRHTDYEDSSLSYDKTSEC